MTSLIWTILSTECSGGSAETVFCSSVWDGRRETSSHVWKRWQQHWLQGEWSLVSFPLSFNFQYFYRSPQMRAREKTMSKWRENMILRMNLKFCDKIWSLCQWRIGLKLTRFWLQNLLACLKITPFTLWCPPVSCRITCSSIWRMLGLWKCQYCKIISSSHCYHLVSSGNKQ